MLLPAVLALLAIGSVLPTSAVTPELERSSLLAVATAPAAPAAPAAETPDAIAQAIVATAAPTAMPGGPIPAGYRISIPRLRIDLPIAEGDLKRDTIDRHTPDDLAFHFPGTALPGQNGNIYLYAHARQGMFLALWNARPGDEVLISAPDGQVLVYVVRDILPRVAADDVSPTEPTTTERLTLQTSTGPNASDPRFVVFAFPRG